MHGMILIVFGMSEQVIKIWLHDMLNVMESIIQSPLESFLHVLKTKREFVIRKRTPWEYEQNFMLVRREYVYLIIFIKSIHE